MKIMNNNIFGLQRFQLFFRRHIYLNYKGWLIAFSAISGALIFIAVLTSIGHGVIDQKSFIVLSYISLFIGGAIITSASFSEMHKPEKSMHYLTLPASAFEKVFSTWLSTTVIFLLATVAYFYAAWYIASGLAFLLTNTKFATLNLFDAGLWQIMGIYLAVQPVFFLGAVYFKGYNFLKTLLVLFVLSMFNSIFQSVTGLLVFGHAIFNGSMNDVNFTGEAYFMEKVLPAIKIIGLYILPVFLLVVSYIRFNEREV